MKIAICDDDKTYVNEIENCIKHLLQDKKISADFDLYFSSEKIYDSNSFYDVAFLDVTDDTSFDWKDFAEMHIKMQIYGNKAKIDIWNQIEYRFDEFIDYCWDGIHKKISTKERKCK